MRIVLAVPFLLASILIPGEAQQPQATASGIPPLVPSRIYVGDNGFHELRLVRRVCPWFPVAARELQGPVVATVRVVIGREGDVVEVSRQFDGLPAVAMAVEAVVRQWRFRPALLNGVPVEVERNVSISFDAAQYQRIEGKLASQLREKVLGLPDGAHEVVEIEIETARGGKSLAMLEPLEFELLTRAADERMLRGKLRLDRILTVAEMVSVERIREIGEGWDR